LEFQIEPSVHANLIRVILVEVELTVQSDPR